MRRFLGTILALWLTLISGTAIANGNPVYVGNTPEKAVAHMLGRVAPNDGEFSASATYMYVYSVSESTGSILYFGNYYAGSYTVSSARAEVAAAGCSYYTRMSGSVIAPAYSNFLIELYACSYYNAYIGLGYFLGSTAVPAVYFYQRVP